MAFDISSIFENVPKSGTALQTVDIEKLRADEKNFYTVTEDSVAELSANIELVGLQQPLNVRPDPEKDGSYIVVSGHRRLAALRLLVDESKVQFKDVPCMVVENGSEALNELRLIYGNANTRKLSDWELQKQAERVQELFYQLKEEGMEFPGRMRDHVAAACQISKSKLARLKVINEKLEIFLEEWQAGKLAESVAYELAQCPAELQWRIRDIRVKAAAISPNKLKRVREAWAEGCRWSMEHICTVSGKVCGHGDVALRRDLAADAYQDLCKGERCCLTCSYGPKCIYGKCERMCKVAAERLKADNEQRDAAKAKADEKRKVQEFEKFKATVEPYIRAAEAAGLADDVQLKFEYSSCTVGGIKELAENPDLDKGRWMFSKPAAKDVAAIADLMGCSVDFLLGRTEVMAMAQPSQSAAQAALSEGEPRWQTGEPGKSGRYWCKIDFNDGFEPWVEDLTWVGDYWKSLHDDAVVIGWWPLPEG